MQRTKKRRSSEGHGYCSRMKKVGYCRRMKRVGSSLAFASFPSSSSSNLFT